MGLGWGFIFYGLTLLLSANSPPLFGLTREQTLCIQGSRKSTSRSLCQVPSSCVLMLLCFLSHFHTSPCISLLFHCLCSFLFSHQQHWKVEVRLTHALVTMRAFQLLGLSQNVVSMSSSLQAGSV